MFQSNWFEEAEQLVKDYPDWDHEELENKVVEKGMMKECSVLLRYHNINKQRMVENITNKFIYIDDNFKMEYLYTNDFNLLIKELCYLPKTEIIKKALNWLIDRITQVYVSEMEAKRLCDKEYTTLFQTGLMTLYNAIEGPAGKFIDCNRTIQTMLKYLDDSLTFKIVNKLKNHVTDPALRQEIRDHMIVHDILT